LLVASGGAFADDETLMLAPVAIFGVAAGAVVGLVAGYVRASWVVFVGSFAAYVVLSAFASMAMSESPGAFLFSVAYAVLIGILVYSAAYYALWRVGRRLRRRRRDRLNEARRSTRGLP
jgi:uncharacterized membrane protein